MTYGVKGAFGACAIAATLSGCLSDMGNGWVADNIVSRTRFADPLAPGRKTHSEVVNAESQIIQGLAARRSALPPGSSFDQVAKAVLAANSRTAEAELRAARLRSEAASMNWLPRIGPDISLTSLGSVVANLVVDQVLFDNGRKKGEREFAIADVEVAAVTLAVDTNDRVHTGLTLYVTAAEAREKAVLSEAALRDMGHFEYVMGERVRGGVSDMSDLNILRQKLAEIRATQTANAELARTSLAELNAMAIQPVSDLRGVPELAVSAGTAQPLPVVLAEAEKTRSIARAKVERAGQLPGLSAGGTVGDSTNVGLRVTSDSLIGFGTGATLRAIEAAKETAARRVAQAQEDSARSLRKLESQIAAKSRQATEAARLTAQARGNLDLFQQQYDAGQRQVMDVVGVYETFARQQQAEVSLKYEVVRLRLDMARLLGVLADGDQI
ncbi:TolC family protein [Sulfitobacter sp. G21635-S1]|uniref:TolC family protein n=1 Tax=Sulfitobacter sp. G21635-S1 TaxID=3014043 RepID=UPI0022B00725|nr:TolC family protein [Sulfitobacter sp. G21635-S1]MCZ4257897.1 TolC family protein [Sulfitobacter sp. G21635-S1]